MQPKLFAVDDKPSCIAPPTYYVNCIYNKQLNRGRCHDNLLVNVLYTHLFSASDAGAAAEYAYGVKNRLRKRSNSKRLLKPSVRGT